MQSVLLFLSLSIRAFSYLLCYLYFTFFYFLSGYFCVSLSLVVVPAV